MGIGVWNYNTVSMASGNSLSAELDLGRGYPTIYLEISSTPSQSEHQIYAAAVASGVFNPVYQPSVNSSTVSNNIYKIGSGITGALVPIPGGLRHIKVYATAAMTNGAAYRIHVGDD